MTQLYIGNIPESCTDEYLKSRFQQHGEIKEILLKGKFAFLEYEDPKAAELAIQFEKEMVDSSLMLHVELANRQVKPTSGPVNLHLLNIPAHANWEKLLTMLGEAGNIIKSEIIDDGEKHEWKRGILTYETKDEAQTAIDRFHDEYFEGFQLQIICPEPGPNSPLKQDKISRLRKNSSELKKKIEESDFPVRIVVPSNMIGAIIGKEGKTIRRITESTGARVDIHRKDNAHSLKKAITVFGNADTCNQAISMILTIMQEERATLSKPTMATYKQAVLELLAHNNLLMEIFGPRHMGLNDLQNKTHTRIMITQSDELGKKQSQDRHIIIQGSPEACCEAQREISDMLRRAFDRDMKKIIQMTNQNAAMIHQSPGYMTDMGMLPQQHAYKPQMASHNRNMRYSSDNQMYNKLVLSPRERMFQPPSPSSSTELLHKILAEMQLRQQQLSDYQREQLVLAGQMDNTNYNIPPSMPQPAYQKYTSPMKYDQGYEDLRDTASGYNPFRSHKTVDRMHMTPPHLRYPAAPENGDMIQSILKDIITGLDDDTVLSPPQQRVPRPAPPHTSRNPAFWHENSNIGPRYMPAYLNSSGSSSYNSSEETSPTPDYTSMRNNAPKYTMEPKKEDFLSDSVLKGTWSNADDSGIGSLVLENSNYIKENQLSDNSDYKYGSNYSNNYSNYSDYSNTSYSSPNMNSYPPYEVNNSPSSLLEWTSPIPLHIAQRIEACKSELEAMTGTSLYLSRPWREHAGVVQLKVVGSAEGTQEIQKKVLAVCKQN